MRPGEKSMTEKIVFELSDLHIEQLHALYQHEWWTKGRTLEATRRVVQGSQVVIALLDGGDRIVGFVRVLSDYTFKALIFDVIVAAHARHLGLGSRLISLVTDHPALRDVRHFELYCLPELVSFYGAHGFSDEVGNIRLMRRVTPSA